MSDWSDDAIETAEKLFKAGKSASAISKVLKGQGVEKSRNAVIGLLTRRGLKRSPISKNKSMRLGGRVSAGTGAFSPQVRQLHPKAKNVQAVNLKRKLAKLEEEVREEIKPLTAGLPPPDAPGPDAVRLRDLEGCRCKWPVGHALGADQLFCGVAYPNDARDLPYCDDHGDRAISAAWRLQKAKGKHTSNELARSLRRYA